jgi:hypothetical protein
MDLILKWAPLALYIFISLPSNTSFHHPSIVPVRDLVEYQKTVRQSEEEVNVYKSSCGRLSKLIILMTQ